MSDARAAIEAIRRIEAPKLIASIARTTRDLGLAEEFVQEALVAALEQWPESGTPSNPAAWLMTTAKRRAIDWFRRQRRHDEKLELIARTLEASIDMPSPDTIEDDLLRMVFTACHPVLSIDAQVALSLRLLGGLTTDEIARAFMVPGATMAQRLVRAKRTLRDAGVKVELPGADERASRLGAVLGVIYLIFNEGYVATAGSRWMRPELCEEALRLGRVLAGLLPGESEVHGLVALMELQASRLRARLGNDGAPVLLQDQDRARWDRFAIARGLRELDAAARNGALGSYGVQAAIAACHARAATAEATDWAAIVGWYDALLAMTPSPIVALNRAVAVGMAHGPAAALPLVEELADEAALRDSHLVPSVLGDLYERLGRLDDAREAFARAAALARNEAERGVLRRRAEALGAS